MLTKTRGIVLNYIRHRETSIIARVFTEELGLKSYIVNSVRTKKPKHSIGIFQPLTLLDMVVYNRENADLNRISELRIHHPFASIPFEISKTYIAFFVTELLMKTLSKEEEPDKNLFKFLINKITLLDEGEYLLNEFPVKLLADICVFMGIMVQNMEELLEHLRENHPGADKFHLNEQELTEANQLIQDPDKWVKQTLSTPILRKKVFHLLLHYLELHFDNIKNMHSVKILEEL